MDKDPRLFNYFLSCFPAFGAIKKRCLAFELKSLILVLSEILLELHTGFSDVEMPVWLYQYVFSHVCISASLHINHAPNVRELVDFLFLVSVYSDLAVSFTSSSAHLLGLFVQPRSQGLFLKPGKRPWERGCFLY